MGTKLGRKIKTERPDGYYELAEKVLMGQMPEEDAARLCGFSRQWFRILVKRDFPGRERISRNPGVMAEIGRKNRKWTTYIEQNISDQQMCKTFKDAHCCDSLCPLYKKCKGKEKNDGLIGALLEKVPYKGLKPAQNTLEEE